MPIYWHDSGIYKNMNLKSNKTEVIMELRKWTMPKNYLGSKWPEYYVFLDIIETVTY